MSYAELVSVQAMGLFAGMLVLLEIGRRLGQRHWRKNPEGARAGVAVVEGAVFGLLGLLLAFTFSGAASRFDSRRNLIVEETNAIGTAYLRLDLLSVSHKATMQELFRRYVDARLEVYHELPDLDAAKESLEKVGALQGEIWREAVAACRENQSQPTYMLLLPSLNQMFDIAATRTMAAKTHPPAIIFAMLSALVMIGSLLAGVGMAGSATRSWIHIFAFAAILAATLYVVLDLEYPRLGLIQIDAFDQMLVDLRHGMK